MTEPRLSERSIFESAIEKGSPQERAAYLDQACGRDAELRRQIEALLAAHDDLGAVSLPSRAINQGATVDDPIRERPGTVIGPYKLLEQIGEGGFGVVFMAEQQQPIRRKVALKVLKPGMDTRQVVARFEAERQALALMDHPHIAHVFDGGETAGGRPYFVMELVRGIPVTDFCDQNRLSIRERLELFVDVCQAVQHAHQKGIIHRDLKPSNVMVTLHDGTPVVKVIDFGIAKATGQQLTDKTLFTHFAQMIGTPLYMSPEQAGMSGLDVDTRSDIYSLGVLLYELLTGTTPFDRERLREADYDEIRRIIREEEPVRPSTRISTLGQAAATASTQRQSEPKRLSQVFRGELDWIVMMALEKDRNRRYQTVNAFAADVQRYLHDEPVLACPPSAWYRFRKFTRRHKARLAVAMLVLFFLASLGGVAGWAVLQKKTQRAALKTDIGRDLETAQDFCRQDRLREASSVLDHAQSLAARGGADEVLGERVAQLRKDMDVAVRLEAIRVEKAWTKDGEQLDKVGTVLRYTEVFRDYGLDLDQLEPDVAAARIEITAIREQLIAAIDDWLWAVSPDSDTRPRLLAVLARADADPWRRQLRVAWMNSNHKELRELARQVNAPAQPPTDAVLLGGALLSLGDTGLAVDFLRRAQREHPSDFWLNHESGMALKHLKPSPAAEAVGYFRAALALRPDNPGSLVALANALIDQGDFPAAVAACQKAVALNPDFAAAYDRLAFFLLELGDLAGARAACQKAIALKPDLDRSHWNMGNILRRQGDLPGAAAEYRKAIALKPDDAVTHFSLSKVLQQQGDLAGAAAAYQKGAALRPDLARGHANRGDVLQQQGHLADAQNRLGIDLAHQGDLPGAIAAFKKAIAHKPDFPQAHYNLGMALRDRGDLSGAIAAYQKAIALKPDYGLAHNNLGVALRDQGDLPGAIAAYRKSIAFKPDFAEAHCNLGIALRQQGEFATALEEMRRGHELGSKDPRWRHPSAQWIRQCQRLLDLDGRLSDIRAGKAAPANSAERIELAQLCAFKQRNRAALRFYEEAFAAQPSLLAVHRYNAACAAALTGCGRGQDADKLDEKERGHLRSLALEWLRTDLEVQSRLLDKGPARVAANVAKNLQHWLTDPDFGGVREPQALAKLPEAERPAWQKLWKDVAEMMKKAQGKAAPLKK